MELQELHSYIFLFRPAVRDRIDFIENILLPVIKSNDSR